MLCYTLREVPENAEHIEKIVFHENVNLVPLLRSESPILKYTQPENRRQTPHSPRLFHSRSRTCMLMRIVGRFSCYALQNAWTPELKEALDALATDRDETVQKVSHRNILERARIELNLSIHPLLCLISARQRYNRGIFPFFVLQCSTNRHLTFDVSFY